MSTQALFISGLEVAFDHRKTSNDTHILFLHGLQSRKEVFHDLQERLGQDFSYSQIAIDYIGFGASEKPKEFSYDLQDQASIIERLLNQRDITNIIIIGHSVGGMIGTLLLESKTISVQAFVSLEGNLALEDCGESRNVVKMSFEEFLPYYKELDEKLSKAQIERDTFRGTSLKMTPAKAFYETSKAIVHWSEKGGLDQLFTHSPVPKMLVTGGQSHFKSHPEGQSITHARLEECSHAMILEEPEELYNMIKDYLKSINL